ncbi:unnamed protein product [Orchesella dallaii]|uniref:Uncharacterized protein n=1 Tax=Orchesella dallaii TaxID=48710 RepID=A0ABP1RTV7_9HEXA
MFSILLLLTSLVFTSALPQVASKDNLSEHTSKTIAWALGNGVDPSQLDPAGGGADGDLYVGRARIEGSWVPGKAFFRAGQFMTAVAFEGEEIEVTDAQVLLRGGTRWAVETNTRKIPASAVVIGTDPRTGEDTYACRGYVQESGDSYLLIGKVINGNIHCSLPHYGETVIYSFEVLVAI